MEDRTIYYGRREIGDRVRVCPDGRTQGGYDGRTGEVVAVYQEGFQEACVCLDDAGWYPGTVWFPSWRLEDIS